MGCYRLPDRPKTERSNGTRNLINRLDQMTKSIVQEQGACQPGKTMFYSYLSYSYNFNNN